MKKTFTCIVCPSGCEVEVDADHGEIRSVTGNGCARGKAYAEEEFLHPTRMLTTTVLADGFAAPVIPVRTSKPIPKDRMADAMNALQGVVAHPPFEIGRVVVKDLLGMGADIIMTNM